MEDLRFGREGRRNASTNPIWASFLPASSALLIPSWFAQESLCELGRVEQALSKAGPWRSRGRRFRGLGRLVQIDGSHHRWLDEQGPQFTLLLAVDGATSAVVNAVFRPEEDTRGYFVLMQGLVQR